MGLFDRMAAYFSGQDAQKPRIEPRADIRAIDIEEFARLLAGGFLQNSSSGVSVNPDTAMRHAAVASCVRVLAESIGATPLILYKRGKGNTRERADQHPLYQVLKERSNDWLTSVDYTEGQVANLCLRGNAYAYVDRNSKGQVIGLTPLNPDGVKIDRARSWGPVYTATMPDNTRATLNKPQIHHIRGPMPVGFLGRSILSMAREAAGLGMAAEQFGANLFNNGIRPSGQLEVPAGIQLSEAQIQRLKAQIEEHHRGQGNWNKTLLLEEGMKWVATSITPDDAQFIETRKLQRSEIAGLFRVPAHLINDLERATFTNIEHQSIDFVMHTLRPWFRRIALSIKRDLLTAPGDDEYFADFLIDDLLRGDFKARMEGYQLQIRSGIASPDEIRAKENEPPRPDGKGSEYTRDQSLYPPPPVQQAANPPA